MSGDHNLAASTSINDAVAPAHTEQTDASRITVLWWIWAVMLVGGLVADHFGSDLGSQFGRLGSSVVLVFAGWMWFGICRETPSGRYILLIAIGMTLGAIGDFFMAGRLQAIITLPNPALGGMAAFGLGHIVYITGSFVARRRAQLNSASAMWGSIIAWQILSAIGWYLVVFLSTKESTQLLVWPALPYSQLLAGTAGVATGLAVQNRKFTLLAIGAALFLISDLILAWGMFRDPFPFRTLAVWGPYGGGQMMIVYAIVTARSAFQDD